MPVIVDLPYQQFDDGTLLLDLEPPIAVGGQPFQFLVTKHFGGQSGIVSRVCDSGYGAGQSGITVVSSGAGRFSISLKSSDLSGYDPGNYAARFQRLQSGAYTTMTEGFLTVAP